MSDSATPSTLPPELPVDLSIVIPCYNEGSGLTQLVSDLGPVLRDLSTTGSVEVVLVDDGSSDDTWAQLATIVELLPQTRVTLRQHEINRGLGAALRTGFAACRGNVIVTTDSDSTYRFSEIPALLARLTDDIAIVTASPYHPQGAVADVPRYRLVLSRGSSLLYRALVSPRIFTYTALFRAYRSEVVRDVPFQSDGFLAVAELLVNAVLAGYRVAEYPTVLHSRVIGTSKAKLLRTIVAHVRFQLQVLRRRLTPRSHGAPTTAPGPAWRHNGI